MFWSSYNIEVPTGAHIFLIEDDETRIDWFRRELNGQAGYLFQTKNPDEALADLKTKYLQYDLFFFDHDLGGPWTPPFSTVVAKFLAKQEMPEKYWERVLIHSHNPIGVSTLHKILPYAHVRPFGTFKLTRPWGEVTAGSMARQKTIFDCEVERNENRQTDQA